MSFNRQEICDEVKKLLPNCSTLNDDFQQSFTGFANDEVHTSKFYMNNFDSFLKKQCANELDSEISKVILNDLEVVMPNVKAPHKKTSIIKKQKSGN